MFFTRCQIFLVYCSFFYEPILSGKFYSFSPIPVLVSSPLDRDIPANLLLTGSTLHVISICTRIINYNNICTTRQRRRCNGKETEIPVLGKRLLTKKNAFFFHFYVYVTTILKKIISIKKKFIQTKFHKLSLLQIQISVGFLRHRRFILYCTVSAEDGTKQEIIVAGSVARILRGCCPQGNRRIWSTAVIGYDRKKSGRLK